MHAQTFHTHKIPFTRQSCSVKLTSLCCLQYVLWCVNSDVPPQHVCVSVIVVVLSICLSICHALILEITRLLTTELGMNLLRRFKIIILCASCMNFVHHWDNENLSALCTILALWTIPTPPPHRAIEHLRWNYRPVSVTTFGIIDIQDLTQVVAL